MRGQNFELNEQVRQHVDRSWQTMSRLVYQPTEKGAWNLKVIIERDKGGQILATRVNDTYISGIYCVPFIIKVDFGSSG
jgi:hypothetical protein